MKRIGTATRVVNKFGAGKDGFTDGDVIGGMPATDLEAALFDNMQEELASIVEGAGLVLSGAVLTQVRQAIKRMAGGNVTTVNFAASPFALTADHAGLVLVDATAGNVVINLPEANAVSGAPLTYRFRRVDTATGNTVTVNRAGINTIDEGGTSFTLAPKLTRSIAANGVATWSTVDGQMFASNAEAQALAATDRALSPATLAAALQGSNQSLVAAGGYQKLPGALILQWGTSAGPGPSGTITFPVAFPTSCFICFAGDFVSIGTVPLAIGTNPSASNFTYQQSSGAAVDAFCWFALGK